MAVLGVTTALLAAAPRAASANPGAAPASAPAGTSLNRLASVSVPEAGGVAADPVAHRVYVARVTGELDVFTEDMLSPIASVAIPINASAIAVDAAAHRAYIGAGTSTTTSITVVDTSTNTVTATVPTGSAPSALGLDPVIHRLYVANYFSSTLSVIDTVSDVAVATLSTAQYPATVAVDTARQLIYVGSQSGTLQVVDASTDTVTALGSLGGGGAGTMALDPTVRRLYVPDTLSPNGGVVTMDVATGTLLRRTPTGSSPDAASVDPLTDSVYVANFSSDTLSVVRGASGVVVGTLAVPAPQTVATDLANRRLFVISRPFSTSTGYTWTLIEYAIPTPTSTSLSSSRDPSSIGQPVTFVATVRPAVGSLVPTGTVGFYDGGSRIGSGRLDASGRASFSTSSLGLGDHTIVASYGGDTFEAASRSAPLTQRVGLCLVAGVCIYLHL